MIKLVIHESGSPSYPEHWADVRSAFDIPFVYKVGGSQSKGFIQVENINDIQGHICALITPAEAKADKIDAIDLWDYDHPEKDVVYVFGPDDDQKGWHKNWSVNDFVTIRTPSATELYASHAAAMVLYDRLSKWL